MSEVANIVLSMMISEGKISTRVAPLSAGDEAILFSWPRSGTDAVLLACLTEAMLVEARVQRMMMPEMEQKQAEENLVEVMKRMVVEMAPNVVKEAKRVVSRVGEDEVV